LFKSILCQGRYGGRDRLGGAAFTAEAALRQTDLLELEQKLVAVV